MTSRKSTKVSTKSNDVSVGTSVLTKVDPRGNNGDDVAAALVTKVNEVDDEKRLNLRVFLDTGMDLRLTNIKLVDSEPDDEDDDVDKDVSNVPQVAWLA